MLFVTFHGGNSDKNPKKNNVHAFDKDGDRRTPSVLDDCDDIILNELRGISFFNNYLYVVNANNEQNSVLVYEGLGLQYRYVSTFASSKSCPGILHPFDLTFDGQDYCYLSSQDTNVVTRLIVEQRGKTARPAPVSSALPTKGKFLPGTFVASSVGTLLPMETTPIKPPAGLQYAGPSAATDKKHSVRGVLWAEAHLYVVDQPAGTVKVYDIQGKYLGQSNVIETPVHIIVNKRTLYVSGGDQIFCGKLPTHGENFQLSPLSKLKVKNSSGMAFSDSGHFYVASRTERRIHKFDTDFQPMKFDCELKDDPEFLLHV